MELLTLADIVFNDMKTCALDSNMLLPKFSNLNLTCF